MPDPRFVKVGEIPVSHLFVNVVSTALCIPTILLFAFIELQRGRFVPRVIDVAWMFATIFLIIVLHESLHAIGYRMFGRLSWSQIKLGVNWKALVPYCNCLTPVSLPQFRMVGLLPTLVLFPVTVVIWGLSDQWWIAFVSAVTLLGGVGDAIMILKTLGQPRHLFILENPSGIGGDLYMDQADRPGTPVDRITAS